jgi:hypothetical protein
MEEPGTNHRFPKNNGRKRKVPKADEPFDIYERLAALDGAMQRMHNRLHGIETELQEIQELMQAEEDENAGSQAG